MKTYRALNKAFVVRVFGLNVPYIFFRNIFIVAIAGVGGVYIISQFLFGGSFVFIIVGGAVYFYYLTRLCRYHYLRGIGAKFNPLFFMDFLRGGEETPTVSFYPLYIHDNMNKKLEKSPLNGTQVLEILDSGIIVGETYTGLVTKLHLPHINTITNSEELDKYYKSLSNVIGGLPLETVVKLYYVPEVNRLEEKDIEYSGDDLIFAAKKEALAGISHAYHNLYVAFYFNNNKADITISKSITRVINGKQYIQVNTGAIRDYIDKQKIIIINGFKTAGKFPIIPEFLDRKKVNKLAAGIVTGELLFPNYSRKTNVGGHGDVVVNNNHIEADTYKTHIYTYRDFTSDEKGEYNNIVTDEDGWLHKLFRGVFNNNEGKNRALVVTLATASREEIKNVLGRIENNIATVEGMPKTKRYAGDFENTRGESIEIHQASTSMKGYYCQFSLDVIEYKRVIAGENGNNNDTLNPLIGDFKNIGVILERLRGKKLLDKYGMLGLYSSALPQEFYDSSFWLNLYDAIYHIPVFNNFCEKKGKGESTLPIVLGDGYYFHSLGQPIEIKLDRPGGLEATHMVVVGATGSGKTVFLNNYMRGVIQKNHQKALIMISDLDGGYKMFVRQLKNMGLPTAVLSWGETKLKDIAYTPFDIPRDSKTGEYIRHSSVEGLDGKDVVIDNFKALHSFFGGLIGGGTIEYTGEVNSIFNRALTSFYNYWNSSNKKKLRPIMDDFYLELVKYKEESPDVMRKILTILRNFVSVSKTSESLLFNNRERGRLMNIDYSSGGVFYFDMKGMDFDDNDGASNYHRAIVASLYNEFLLLIATLPRHMVKKCIGDESWKALQNKDARSASDEVLRIGRKLNSALVLASQNVTDFTKASGGLQEVIIRNYASLVVMDSTIPPGDQEIYRKVYGFSEKEIKLLTGMKARINYREFFYYSKTGSTEGGDAPPGVYELHLTDLEKKLYFSTAEDVRSREDLIAKNDLGVSSDTVVAAKIKKDQKDSS